MCACAAFRRIVSKSCSEIRMLNCLSFFMFPPFSLKWVWASARFEAFGREPVDRRLAKCDAGSFVGTSSISLAPPQAAGLVHSAAPPLKIAIALLDCDFVFFAHVGATWGAVWHTRAHTRSLLGKPHTAATRASRRGAGARPAGRVDRVDFSHSGKIGTIGPFQANQPLSVALSERYQNAVFP